SVFEPVGLATHYHTVWIYPYWAPSLDHIGTIGAHRFYKWKGNAGKASAFRARYSGIEPAAARPGRAPNDGRAASDPLGRADPIALARAYEQGRLQGQESAASLGATVHVAGPAARQTPGAELHGSGTIYSDTSHRARNLPESGKVKAQYANSGRWIDPPD
ncbi:MAG: cell wall hydrolase, partial [Pontixanthobacter sp.]